MQQFIQSGKAVLGIEFGSTRIKAVLINPKGEILSTGIYDWENQFINEVWTYSQEEIWHGLQGAYADLASNVRSQFGVPIRKLAAIGISGMMHGYLPFDKDANLLTPFRTWRNNFTSKSAEKLTALFNHNIPQRWSIAHLYQAILNNEPHVAELDFFTTLAGYVHWQLTGEKVLGIGDASGMFPIDIAKQDYDQSMLAQFDSLISDKNYPWKINTLLPKVLSAGKMAGKLTTLGAKLLDLTGNLEAGVSFCPPEGDAGTGMVATNSIAETTGNISAGTSAFAMIVLEKNLSRVYPELDLVTTPAGKLVAMAHANNCSTDINAWMKIFEQNLQVFGVYVTKEELFEALFNQALQGEPNCGGLLSYGFYSGEHNVGLEHGCPMLFHPTNAEFNLANLIRVHLYSAFAAMKIGMDILIQQENVQIRQILGHGGMFKTPKVAAQILASALNIPVATQSSAGEGGAWGIALLANFLNYANKKSLEQYLNHIFKIQQIHIAQPDLATHLGYQNFIDLYKKGIDVVKQAVETNLH